MGDEAVVVGVRVRPFNDREKGLGATCCVRMQGPNTEIKADDGREAKFAFDASFWSHDQFTNDDTGYSHPNPGSNYADQNHVFECFGQRVLNNAWAGYHVCLFAYGQTGAGKSYSMIGYGANKGIVPISCEEIFRRVGENDCPELKYEVLVSMVEIYNETVQDLFVPQAQRSAKGLDIRESKTLGVFVDGVVKLAVDSYESIEKAIDMGSGNRQVGATAMNATSSRSHVVITIEFKQVRKNTAMGESVIVSNINLVDLAGSEKSTQTGATGDTLKEGNAINKSLSALGNVISKLADKATGKCSAKEPVPYRDSKLTRLLQNALGGSSKTVMVCAISPASTNYEETLSTLRYADRAKKIKNTAVVNENPMEKLLREMKEENEKLRQMLEGRGGAAPVPEQAAQEAEQLEKVQLLRKAMQENDVDFSERLAESRELERSFCRRAVLSHGSPPCLMNINQESNLTGKLKYEIPEGNTLIIGGPGVMNMDSSDGESDCDDDDESSDDDESQEADEDDEEDDEFGEDAVHVDILAKGVLPKHAAIINIRNQCFLVCRQGGAFTWVNGVVFDDLVRRAEDENSEEEIEERPEDSCRLNHGDRVSFGRGIFMFGDPKKGLVEMLCLKFPYMKARKELPAGWKYKLDPTTKKSVFMLHAAAFESDEDEDEDSDEDPAAVEARLNSNLAARDRIIKREKQVAAELYAKLTLKDRQVSRLVKVLADIDASRAGSRRQTGQRRTNQSTTLSASRAAHSEHISLAEHLAFADKAFQKGMTGIKADDGADATPPGAVPGRPRASTGPLCGFPKHAAFDMVLKNRCASG